MTLKYFLNSPSKQLLLLLVLAFTININTVFNDYALDDGVVLTENSIVAKGIKGIPEILTTDLFYGFKNKDAFSNLAQSRYRPVPLIIFAIEYQCFGANPFVSHLLNIFCFLLLILLLFKLLNEYLFIEKPLVSFFSCLLFVVHPIHTEVIANVKSRDEIIAGIFVIASLIFLIKYLSGLKKRNLFAGLFLFLFALFSKESAITFLAVLPLVVYYFYKLSAKKSIIFTLPLILVSVLYFIIRLNISGFAGTTKPEVLNSPYLLASPSEAFATKCFVVFKYLSLLLFPYPLSHDYGYNVIPYIEFSSLKFIFSFLILISLILYAFITLQNRNLISFCILFFFITIAPGTNFLNDLGTFLAERILFVPSLAFCIAVAYLFSRIQFHHNVLPLVVIIIVIATFSFLTFSRNYAWKNNETLALTDVKFFPNSVRANFASTEINLLKANAEKDPAMKNKYFKDAVVYGEQTIKLYPDFPVAYMNLGSAYFGLTDYFRTADNWKKAYNMMPDEPRAKYFVEYISKILFEQGEKYYNQNMPDVAVQYFNKSVEADDKNVSSWVALYKLYISKNDTLNANAVMNNIRNLNSEL